MGRAVSAAATGVLLSGPAVLAFFSGGYFDGPRLAAAFAVWTIVLGAAIWARRPYPASRAGRAAAGGLILLCAWTTASLAWAPLSSPAVDASTRVLLYVGALLAAAALLRDRGAARAVEPALALGATVVLGYGLAGRLVPSIVELDVSFGSGGRLEQPITYWNAEGILAAVGLVLCARLIGDRTRPMGLRAAASAASAILAAGLYLTYSRGALAAGLVGLVVLLAAAPDRSQLRALGRVVVTGVLASVCVAGLPGIGALRAGADADAGDGAIALVALLAVMASAALVTVRSVLRERRGQLDVGPLAVGRRLAALAAVAIAVTAAGLVADGLRERGGEADLAVREGAARLTATTSRRYDYWAVGLRTFADHPLRGMGAGGFRVAWLKERPVPEGAREVHSLPLEVALELGVVGLLGLVLFVAGGAGAARAAVRRNALLAAGPAAACTAWAVHATIDWDWQVPAVTLPAVILAGCLIAAGEAEPGAEPGREVARATDVPEPAAPRREPAPTFVAARADSA
jgi:O-antigen ligase